MNSTIKEKDMKSKARLLWTIALAFSFWLSPGASAHEGHEDSAIVAGRSPDTQPGGDNPDQTKAAVEMADAAMRLWAALTPEEQAKAGFAFDDQQRFDWHFIPRQRKGLPYKEMTAVQQTLAHSFIASGLSQRGYTQAGTIMSLEEVLKQIEQGKGPVRDPENYAFSIFGTPGERSTWGWRVEGHHLSLNFTIVKGKAVAGGPIFFGTNPAEVRFGPRKGLRVLAVEEDLGRELIKSLDEKQRPVAIINVKAPADIITGHDRKAHPGPPVGIAASDMTPAQKKMLMTLIENYAYRLRSALADEDLKEIEQAGVDKIHFAWAGGLEPGEGHYYRIHGPTFLIEFDNTQDHANHIHTVWRDHDNDFGEDLLRKHYDDLHHEAETQPLK